MHWLQSTLMTLCLTASLSAATYYVDFEGGKDTNDGTTPATAFQHAPGDAAATGAAKAVTLAPGDVVVFKGGVRYRGTIVAGTSGEAGKPIVYDGNSAGTFGQGRAIIDGAGPVGGWKKFSSAEEALGNPDWQQLVYTENLPARIDPLTAHLMQGERLMYLAQTPAPEDLFWWDDLSAARVAAGPPAISSSVTVAPSDGRKVTGGYHWQNLIDGTKNPTYLNPAKGAELVITLAEPVTAERFAFSYGIDDARITHITLTADGREILSRPITAEENAGKQVELKPDRPATFRTLAVRIDAFDGGPKKLPSVRIAEFQAFDAGGRNVFDAFPDPTSRLADPEFLNQTDPHAWAGSIVAILGKPMRFYFAPVQGFDPAGGTIRFRMMTAEWYTASQGGTRYFLLNAPHALIRPGQYVLWRGRDGRDKPRLIAWPWEAATFEQDARIGERADGFVLAGVSHVTVRGFTIRGQAGKAHAIRTSGATSHLTIDNNQIRHLRSSLADRNAAILLTQTSDFVITNNDVAENVRTIGVMVTRSQRGRFADNTLKRNGDTQVDFYTCQDVTVTGNVINEANGHHSNGLTFYLDNRNILVENNRVTCKRPITFHSIDGITIRNNLLNAEKAGNCISIWANTKGSHNVTIERNTLVNAKPDSYEAAIFRGDGKSRNLVVKDNIIDGLGGNWEQGATLSGNLFLRPGKGITEDQLAKAGELVKDPATLFADPTQGNYRVPPTLAKGATLP